MRFQFNIKFYSNQIEIHNNGPYGVLATLHAVTNQFGGFKILQLAVIDFETFLGFKLAEDGIKYKEKCLESEISFKAEWINSDVTNEYE